MKNLILSIETSSNPISTMALHLNSKLLAQADCAIFRSPSQVLSKLFDSVLRSSNYKERDLVAVAVSEGPGSYTGIRVGLSFAKGLTFGLNIPLISISSLSILLEQQKGNEEDCYWIALLPISSQSCAVTIADKTISSLIPPTEINMQEAEVFFRTFFEKKTCYYLGEGATTYANMIRSWKNSFVLPHIHPSAMSMGELAEKFYKKQTFVSPISFSPDYFRTPAISSSNTIPKK